MKKTEMFEKTYGKLHKNGVKDIIHSPKFLLSHFWNHFSLYSLNFISEGTAGFVVTSFPKTN